LFLLLSHRMLFHSFMPSGGEFRAFCHKKKKHKKKDAKDSAGMFCCQHLLADSLDSHLLFVSLALSQNALSLLHAKWWRIQGFLSQKEETNMEMMVSLP